MLVVMLLLPLSLAMDNGEFNHGGGGGGGGGPAAVAVAAVAADDNRDRWWWRLMAAAALDGCHATASRHSKRATQQHDKRAGGARGDNAITS
jgi:hypothetical protein